MSLHVNLILDSERRSGSNVSPKFIVRTTLIVLAAVAGMGVFGLVVAARGAHQARVALESEYDSIESVYKSVILSRGELVKLKKLANMLAGWNTTRMAFSQYLRSLQLCVPPGVQLTRLTAQKNIDISGGMPHWGGDAYLRGRVGGAGADADVRQLRLDMKNKPPFDKLMEQVEVISFAADEEDVSGATRRFDIECRFAARKIVPPQ